MIEGAQECHEDIGVRGGPCGKPAVGHRLDPESGEPYPVCWRHVRPVMVEKATKGEPMAQITMTEEELLGLVFEAAGAATAPIMADHPGYVFPSEQVAGAVTRVIEEKTDITVSEVPGYEGVPS